MPKAVIKFQALTSCASISFLTAQGPGGLSDPAEDHTRNPSKEGNCCQVSFNTFFFLPDTQDTWIVSLNSRRVNFPVWNRACTEARLCLVGRTGPGNEISEGETLRF